MISSNILFYDTIICGIIGFIYFVIGIQQILVEPRNYGLIGYYNHRVYTIIGLLQIINIIRIIDDSETIRIFTQWLFDIQSMIIIYGILFFSIHIITLTKNIIYNATYIQWKNLNKMVKTMYMFIFVILFIATNIASLLRIFYPYEFWTIIIILANIIAFLFVTIIMNYYLYIFFNETNKIVNNLHSSNNKIQNVIKDMQYARIIYIILVIPTFGFLGNFVFYYFTEFPMNLNNFNYNISYLRYIILLTCLAMAWLSYIKKSYVSPIKSIRKSSNGSLLF